MRFPHLGDTPEESAPASGSMVFPEMDNYALKRYIGRLRTELHDAERELWRRTAVCLARFPSDWREPGLAMLWDDERREWYRETVEEAVGEALESIGCRPGREYPWTEVWGEPGRLGPAPDRSLEEIIRRAHERAAAAPEEDQPWR